MLSLVIFIQTRLVMAKNVDQNVKSGNKKMIFFVDALIERKAKIRGHRGFGGSVLAVRW